MSELADKNLRRRPLENSQPERPAVVGSLMEVARVTTDETDRLLAALGPPAPHVPKSPGALAALENAERAVREDPVRSYAESSHRLASLDLLKAVRIAPEIDVCEALLRGEPVPLSRLDPEWAKAYGLL